MSSGLVGGRKIFSGCVEGSVEVEVRRVGVWQAFMPREVYTVQLYQFMFKIKFIFFQIRVNFLLLV